MAVLFFGTPREHDRQYGAAPRRHPARHCACGDVPGLRLCGLHHRPGSLRNRQPLKPRIEEAGMTTTRRDALKTVLGSVALSSVGWEGASAQAGGKFVYANNSPYDNLDPHTIFDTARAATRFNLYDGLYRWVDNPPKMIPWLAESHSVSDDGKAYTFRLRPGAKFHDGKPVTAADVVYSVERI